MFLARDGCALNLFDMFSGYNPWSLSTRLGRVLVIQVCVCYEVCDVTICREGGRNKAAKEVHIQKLHKESVSSYHTRDIQGRTGLSVAPNRAPRRSPR
jgi:hypothetical protein